MVKDFVVVAPDTVEQGKNFVVFYILSSQCWDEDAIFHNSGFKLVDVKYSTKTGKPNSQMTAKTTFLTSRTGMIDLPIMTVKVNGKPVMSRAKKIYVKPSREYGDEIIFARNWLEQHGKNADSINLELQDGSYSSVLVFNDMRNSCFCIIAKKDYWSLVGTPVLAYSTENALDDSKVKGYQEFVRSYTKQILSLKKKSNSELKNDHTIRVQANGSVTPMLQDIAWGQGMPYNKKIPFVGKDNKQAIVGCVPLAATMIMNYYKRPKKLRSYVYYDFKGRVYKMDYSGFYPEWGNYMSKYGINDTVNNSNLALLLSMTGIGIGAQYSEDATSAGFARVKALLCNNMNYSGRMTFNFEPLDDDSLTAIIYRELEEGRPMIVAIDGHAFVCDGCDGDYLHFNLGWYGFCNGYYRLKIANSDNDLLYLKNVLYGIEPQAKPMECEVELKEPGTLEQMLKERIPFITRLVVKGPLNSKDIKLLRKMAGAQSIDGFESWRGGALKVLDLTKAQILADKTPYLTTIMKEKWGRYKMSSGKEVQVDSIDLGNMNDEQWKNFEKNVGTKHSGLIYSRDSENRCWVSYYSRKNVIGKRMFMDCSSLRQIALPEETTKIDDFAFLDCWSLKSMYVPEKVKLVGSIPFCRCISLEELNVPKGMLFSDYIFMECSPILKSVEAY